MIGGVLGLGRGLAESRMTDAVTVTRLGERVWDEEAGGWGEPDVVVYSGRGRVRHASSSAKDVESGSQLLAISQIELHVPVGSPVFLTDDVAVVLSSETRPDQAGRKFVVVAPFDGSQTTALRYRVEVADGR